jgi:hypothetical protein
VDGQSRGAAELTRVSVHDRGQKKSAGGYRQIWQAETMISFLLLKICAFLFASTHLSFFPYCQLHQPEKNVSVMSPINERTYIMVKVRSVTLIVHLLFFCFCFCVWHCVDEETPHRSHRIL